MSQVEKSISLHCQEGGSDKIYELDLVSAPAGWLVNFRNGRRGSALRSGTKTPSALPDRAAAEKIFDKVVREKTSGGYIPQGEAKAYTTGPEAGKDSGIRCQLLNPADDDENGAIGLEGLIQGKDWVAQQKIDGDRRLIQVVDGVARGINRRGLYVPLPAEIAKAYEYAFKDGGVIDGEIVGDRHYAFDLLRVGDKDVCAMPFERRIELLSNILAGKIAGDRNHQMLPIVFVEPAYSMGDKRSLVRETEEKNGEGVVFKHISAPYRPGRPNSGGTALKVKFWESVTARVAANGDKRSVSVELRDDAGWRNVGNVTIPANASIPAPGEIVEVKYLYVLESSKILYQPIYLGPRKDMTENDVDEVSDLKVKDAPSEAPAMRAGMRP